MHQKVTLQEAEEMIAALSIQSPHLAEIIATHQLFLDQIYEIKKAFQKYSHQNESSEKGMKLYQYTSLIDQWRDALIRVFQLHKKIKSKMERAKFVMQCKAQMKEFEKKCKQLAHNEV